MYIAQRPGKPLSTNFQLLARNLLAVPPTDFLEINKLQIRTQRSQKPFYTSFHLDQTIFRQILFCSALNRLFLGLNEFQIRIQRPQKLLDDTLFWPKKSLSQIYYVKCTLHKYISNIGLHNFCDTRHIVMNTPFAPPSADDITKIHLSWFEAAFYSVV